MKQIRLRRINVLAIILVLLTSLIQFDVVGTDKTVSAQTSLLTIYPSEVQKRPGEFQSFMASYNGYTTITHNYIWYVSNNTSIATQMIPQQDGSAMLLIGQDERSSFLNVTVVDTTTSTTGMATVYLATTSSSTSSYVRIGSDKQVELIFKYSDPDAQLTYDTIDLIVNGNASQINYHSFCISSSDKAIIPITDLSVTNMDISYSGNVTLSIAGSKSGAESNVCLWYDGLFIGYIYVHRNIQYPIMATVSLGVDRTLNLPFHDTDTDAISIIDSVDIVTSAGDITNKFAPNDFILSSSSTAKIPIEGVEVVNIGSSNPGVTQLYIKVFKYCANKQGYLWYNDKLVGEITIDKKVNGNKNTDATVTLGSDRVVTVTFNANESSSAVKYDDIDIIASAGISTKTFSASDFNFSTSNRVLTSIQGVSAYSLDSSYPGNRKLKIQVAKNVPITSVYIWYGNNCIGTVDIIPNYTTSYNNVTLGQDNVVSANFSYYDSSNATKYDTVQISTKSNNSTVRFDASDFMLSTNSIYKNAVSGMKIIAIGNTAPSDTIMTVEVEKSVKLSTVYLWYKDQYVGPIVVTSINENSVDSAYLGADRTVSLHYYYTKTSEGVAADTIDITTVAGPNKMTFSTADFFVSTSATTKSYVPGTSIKSIDSYMPGNTRLTIQVLGYCNDNYVYLWYKNECLGTLVITREINCNPYVESVTISPKSVSIKQGGKYSFSAKVKAYNNASENIKWTVNGAKDSTTNIDSNGDLYVGENETAKEVTVRVSSTVNAAACDSATVKVEENIILPEVNEKVTEKGSIYKVLVSDVKNGTVEYVRKVQRASKVTVPSTILIGKYKFKVVSIADNAFKNDTTLTSITLGSNVGKIGKNAFYKCNKLKTIMINSKKLKTVGSSAVKGIKSTATIIIPNGKLIPYQKLFTKTTGYNSRTMKMKTK